MDRPSKLILAELSKLATNLARMRVSPAMKVQRILAIVHDEPTRQFILKAFQNAKINPDEAEYACIILSPLPTPNEIKIIADQILHNKVDIIILESTDLKAEMEIELKTKCSQHSEPDFLVAHSLSLSIFDEIGIHGIINRRRAFFV